MDIALGSNQWADIPSYLLDEIVKFIDSYSDYVSLCGVCKLWNLSLSSEIPRHLKVPLLVLPYEDEDKNNCTRPIYDPGEKKVIHSLQLSTHYTIIHGSSHRWLITIELDNGELQMLQPFTKVRIDLPPLFTFPNIVKCQFDNEYDEYIIKRDDGTIYTNWKYDMGKFYIRKIILSSPPDDDDQDFMAIALYGDLFDWKYEYDKLAYCMRNDKEWKDFIEPKEKPIYEDIIFHQGRIYAIDRMGVIYEYDIKTKIGSLSGAPINKCLSELIYPSCRYLVSTSNGLLSIEKYVFDEDDDSNERSYHTFKFKVFILSESKWVEVKNLGNNIIIVGLNSSTCYAVPLGKGNCIYYSDDRLLFHVARGGHDNGVFYLQDETIHSYDYLFPGNDAVFPLPIWLL